MVGRKMVKKKCSGVICLGLNSSLSFTSCVTMGKSFNLSEL